MGPTLAEIARLFLKLGTIGFGGPAAHIALMDDEVVRKRGWLLREEFLDLLGATNLIPGPNSTELAIHVGYRKAGFRGLLVAGACFILPATLIVMAIAWAYVRFGLLPEVTLVFRSIKPVMVAIVVQALWGLGKTALKTPTLIAVAVGSVILTVLGVNELLVLAIAGAGTAAANSMRLKSTALFSVELAPLFLFFLKIGSVLYGSGYVLLAFLRADLVERWQWLSEGQLLDAIAVGQVTPGPVFTTATFIGYLLAGVPGAAIATVGIFLPAFVFVAISGPLVKRIRSSKIAGSVLDGVNVGSLALMAVVTFQLAQAAVVDLPTGLLALAGLAGVFLLRINSAWLVVGAALVGLLATGSFF
jgi:chromate transporter